MEDRCICCGEIIPEGRQVCWTCEEGAQMNKEGYSVVEVLSPCPINWNLTPIKAMERIDNELISYFPLGEFKQRSVKEA